MTREGSDSRRLLAPEPGTRVRPAPLAGMPPFVPYVRGAPRAAWAQLAIQASLAEHGTGDARRGRPPGAKTGTGTRGPAAARRRADVLLAVVPDSQGGERHEDHGGWGYMLARCTCQR